jgi:hypothetical protein
MKTYGLREPLDFASMWIRGKFDTPSGKIELEWQMFKLRGPILQVSEKAAFAARVRRAHFLNVPLVNNCFDSSESSVAF